MRILNRIVRGKPKKRECVSMSFVTGQQRSAKPHVYGYF